MRSLISRATPLALFPASAIHILYIYVHTGYSAHLLTDMAAPRRTKSFTGEELSRLNQRHNAHVAFDGKVYDVSGFLDKHPGGCDQLMLGAGRDISQLFRSYHKSGTAKLVGEKCEFVGELLNNEMPAFPPSEGEFFRTLRTRVNNYFRSRNIDPKVDLMTFIRYATFQVLSLTLWYLCVTCSASWSLGAVFAAATGFMYALVAMTVGHDGNHFAITHNPLVWRWLTVLTDSITGLSSLSWTYQHTYGHHVYTNIDGSDPDVETVNERPDFWRIKPFQNWFQTYQFQHIYMPLLYPFLAIKMKLQDLHTIFIMKKAAIKINPLSTFQSVGFFTGKAIHLTYRIVIPFFYMPLLTLVLMNLIVDMVMGMWLAIVTQLNHVNTKVSWPDPGSDGVETSYNRSWAEMQLASTVDYATDSWFWTVVTGALNHQVAHHLFPGVLQTYYPAITPIVRETCAEFGIQYYSLPSAWDAVCCHLGYLKIMGAAPNPQTKG